MGGREGGREVCVCVERERKRERERAPWSESVKQQSANPDVVFLSSDDDFTPCQVTGVVELSSALCAGLSF